MNKIVLDLRMSCPNEYVLSPLFIFHLKIFHLLCRGFQIQTREQQENTHSYLEGQISTNLIPKGGKRCKARTRICPGVTISAHFRRLALAHIIIIKYLFH